MSRLRNRLSLGALGLALAGSAVGCVPAEQYAGMKMKADQLSEQLAKSQGDIDRANARADAAEKQNNAINNGNSAQTALLSNQQQQNEELRKQNEDLNQKMANALALAGKAGPGSAGPALPTALNDELKDLAARSPDTIEFDSAHGVVRFKSDVTFPAGETALSGGSKQVLATFATILNSAAAGGYDLLVAGNTDSQPVTNKMTIAHGNFDNWYLSAHRAIAVGHELIADGVQPSRIGTVGYADQRPAVPNTSAENMAKNRRVEVLIVPAAAKHGVSVASNMHPKRTKAVTGTRDVSGTAAAAGATMTKDGGGAAPARTPVPVTSMNK